MQRVLVLADDVTGALEVAAKFAATGLSVLVRTRSSIPVNDVHEVAVLVIDTETRHKTPEQAGRCVFELAGAGYDAGFRWFYKKTDSTLRGNIGAEINALADAFPGFPVLYVPAYPKMGRTVRGGVLCVGGIPVTETSFATDSLNAVRENHIPSLLSAACKGFVISTTAEELSTSLEAAIYVCDGETDSDLGVVARKFAQSTAFRVAAGPAGFVDHIAPLIDLPRTTPGGLPVLRRVLVVNGSRNEVSSRQIQYAREHGCAARSGDEPTAAEEDEEWVILDQASPQCDPISFARRLSGTVTRILRREEFDAVVVFGGDTAYALLEALGSPYLHPVGEVLEGVPISAMRRNSVGLKGDDFLYLISKAGGFGVVDVLSLIKTRLTKG